MLAGALLQRGLDGAAGGVGGVNDAPVTVTALAMQMIIGTTLGVGFHGEGHALLAEPFDDRWPVFHGEPDRVGVAQARSGDQGVLQVGFDGIAGIQHRRYSALGIIGAAFVQRPLGQSDDADGIGQPQRQAQAGGAAADDEDIGETGGGGHDL